MADRSHAMYTVSRRNIHNLDAKRNKARETREFQILFQFQHFSSIAESEACRSIPPDSEMLAETHEINHRRRHWAPFQNRNVTTERSPPLSPSSDDESRTSRIASFLFSLSFSPRFELHCTTLPSETLKTSLWKENSLNFVKFVLYTKSCTCWLTNSWNGSKWKYNFD